MHKHILLWGRKYVAVLCLDVNTISYTFSTTNNGISFIISVEQENTRVPATVDRYHCDENMCIEASTRHKKTSHAQPTLRYTSACI